MSKNPEETVKQQIALLELDRTERLEKVLETHLKAGRNISQRYLDNMNLPYASECFGFVGRGDSRREADCQLASKLSLLTFG
jgi:hypothetical protein